MVNLWWPTLSRGRVVELANGILDRLEDAAPELSPGERDQVLRLAQALSEYRSTKQMAADVAQVARGAGSVGIEVTESH